METINQSQVEEILKKLARLQDDMEYVKRNMVDMDCMLTPEEEKIVEIGLEEFRQGKTTSLDDFEREMRETKKR